LWIHKDEKPAPAEMPPMLNHVFGKVFAPRKPFSLLICTHTWCIGTAIWREYRDHGERHGIALRETWVTLMRDDSNPNLCCPKVLQFEYE
jgi:hypothetical protein